MRARARAGRRAVRWGGGDATATRSAARGPHSVRRHSDPGQLCAATAVLSGMHVSFKCRRSAFYLQRAAAQHGRPTCACQGCRLHDGERGAEAQPLATPGPSPPCSHGGPQCVTVANVHDTATQSQRPQTAPLREGCLWPWDQGDCGRSGTGVISSSRTSVEPGAVGWHFVFRLFFFFPTRLQSSTVTKGWGRSHG